MTQQTMPLWFDIIVRILPVITLIIGAFLTPTVLSRFERKKRRELIKTEIVKNILKGYNYLSTLTNYQNQSAYHKRFYSCMLEYDASTTADKALFEKAVKEQFDLAMDSRNKALKCLEQIVEIEANLTADLVMVKHSFGNKVYKKISSIIIEISRELNRPTLLHNYDEMSLDQVNTISTTLNQKIDAKSIEIMTKCRFLIRNITDLLPI